MTSDAGDATLVAAQRIALSGANVSLDVDGSGGVGLANVTSASGDVVLTSVLASASVTASSTLSVTSTQDMIMAAAESVLLKSSRSSVDLQAPAIKMNASEISLSSASVFSLRGAAVNFSSNHGFNSTVTMLTAGSSDSWEDADMIDTTGIGRNAGHQLHLSSATVQAVGSSGVNISAGASLSFQAKSEIP